MGLGGAALTLAQGIVAILRERVDPQYYQFVGSDPLFAGLIAGAALGALFGWRRSDALDNVWQRGVIGVLSAVGAILVGFLAAVVDRLLGVPGMTLWFVACIALAVAGSRWAILGSRGQPAPRNTP